MSQTFKEIFNSILNNEATAYGKHMAGVVNVSEKVWEGWSRPAMMGVRAGGILAGVALGVPLAIGAAGIGVLSLADDVLLLGGASLAYKALGGWPGMIKAGAGIARGGVETLTYGGAAVEKIARATLIGGIGGKGGRVFGKGTTALDVWFPNLKGPFSKSDARRWAPNTRILPRVTLLAAGFGVARGALGAMGEFTGSAVGPVTAYYDGSNIRHANDMGADASYARSILGRNSGL